MSLYNYLILPHITYCAHAWGSANETSWCQLKTLQNKIVKLFAGVPRRIDADALYVKLNILPLRKLCLYDNDMLPELFVDMFTPVCNIHNNDIRKSAGYHLYVDFHGTIRSQKCIKYVPQIGDAMLCFRSNFLTIPMALRVTFLDWHPYV